MKRKSILLIVLIMAIGFAAVSTTLLINGSTKINPNQEDFNVYYSDAYVNGTQDKSVITDDTHISFTTELSTLGEKYVLDYEVTNGSKNYDAELVMECTGDNEYLTVTNDFDTDTILKAKDSREGKLTLELTKSNAGEDLDVTIACTINANAVERDSLETGDVNLPVTPLKEYYIGEEVIIDTEYFNVISQTENTVKLLAQNNLGTEYKQSSTINVMTFSNAAGWNPGDRIIISNYPGHVKTYLDSYKYIMMELLGSNNIDIDLITINELVKLGCVYYEDNNTGESHCSLSPYSEWLLTDYTFWTSSSYKGYEEGVLFVYADNEYHIYYNGINSAASVRPVITVDKTLLDKYKA